MASFSVLSDFHVYPNESFLEKARELEPILCKEQVDCKQVIYQNESLDAENISRISLKKGDSILLDFGNHYVGHIYLCFKYHGSHPDAPAYIRFQFAERKEEFQEEMREYNGWLGCGWFQEEYIHLDVLPVEIQLPRRYAFRYVSIEVLGTSEKYSLVLCKANVIAESVVKQECVESLTMGDELLERIDKVSLRTLANCMQKVFEDGPKRDRRMWLGDLYLQAKTNHVTYKEENLVKRCLYLFAGLPFNEGKIAACLFTEPVPEPDDTYLFDYALLFGATLWEYYETTEDIETLRELYPTVRVQTDIALSYVTEEDVVPDHSGEFWCFVDWGEDLNVQAASLAILIFGMMHEYKIAECLGDMERAAYLNEKIKLFQSSAKQHYWDDERGFFISGNIMQISWATQIWMVLARVVSKEEGRRLLKRLIQKNPSPGMVSPYIHHYFVEALMMVGEKELAIQKIKEYWGGMIQLGADTFWEVYDTKNENFSPYQSKALNSYCHAWSCTPAYFLRKMIGE